MKRKFVGITKRRGKYRVRITVNGKTYNVGTFNTEQEAAIEYDNASRRLRGQQTSRLNYPGIQVKLYEALKEENEKADLNLSEPIWTSSDGRKTPISLLANNHLRNIERMLRYRGARIPPEGTQAHWYSTIMNEMRRRELEPLEDHPNQTEEVVEIPVYVQQLSGRVVKRGHALVDMQDLPKVDIYEWFDDSTFGTSVPFAPAAGRRTLDSVITGNIKHRIMHRNGNPRDCTRKNLIVDEPRNEYKVRPDNVRVLEAPQGLGVSEGETSTPDRESEWRQTIAQNQNKNSKFRMSKDSIRARLHEE